uniref:Glutamate decarboxylase 2 n=1 Tax=Meleagris gallopavo TaxID=9103 RepID=G1N532_MELGA
MSDLPAADPLGVVVYVVKSFDRSTKVIDFHYPNELLQEYNWELAEQPQTLEEILLNCRTTLKYAIKTGHPRYFNQLSTGLDMVGLAADWLTSAANTNMFTYEIAPVFVLLEYVTLRKMREMVGWPGGCGDGIFSPGGAISNMYAMLIARFKMFPEVKEKGMAAIPRLVAFTSEHVCVSVFFLSDTSASKQELAAGCLHFCYSFTGNEELGGGWLFALWRDELSTPGWLRPREGRLHKHCPFGSSASSL